MLYVIRSVKESESRIIGKQRNVGIKEHMNDCKKRIVKH